MRPHIIIIKKTTTKKHLLLFCFLLLLLLFFFFLFCFVLLLRFRRQQRESEADYPDLHSQRINLHGRPVQPPSSGLLLLRTIAGPGFSLHPRTTRLLLSAKANVSRPMCKDTYYSGSRSCGLVCFMGGTGLKTES